MYFQAMDGLANAPTNRSKGSSLPPCHRTCDKNSLIGKSSFKKWADWLMLRPIGAQDCADRVFKYVPEQKIAAMKKP